MKFNVSSKTLYNFVSSVSKIIPSKNTMQILNNFLFILEEDTLIVKASDMENSLVGRVHVHDAEGSGRFCLDARRVVELFKELPDQGIEFEVDDENLEVKIAYNSGCYNSVAINGLEYPDKAGNDDDSAALKFTIGGNQTMRGIENTMFAVGTDEIHPQMTGILWDIKPDRIIFVATDSRKLVKFTDCSIQTGLECSFILPIKGATVLKNVFSKDEEIAVKLTATSATFTSEAFTFECRLIKGAFPDYNRVIPSTNPYMVSVDRHSLFSALRRVAIFGNEGGGLVKFKFTPNKIVLRSCDNSFATSGWEEVPCNYEGTDLMMGFSAPFLLEILSTFSSAEVHIKIADPSRPVLCLPADNDPDTELLMILMPMNIVD